MEDPVKLMPMSPQAQYVMRLIHTYLDEADRSTLTNEQKALDIWRITAKAKRPVGGR